MIASKRASHERSAPGASLLPLCADSCGGVHVEDNSGSVDGAVYAVLLRKQGGQGKGMMLYFQGFLGDCQQAR